jgi:arylsulfatase A-like enzyme
LRFDQHQESPEPILRVRTRFNRLIAELAHRVGPLGRVYDDLYFEYRQRIGVKAESWETLRSGPGADVLFDRANEWLGSLGQQPFFLWLHFMDPHAPYYPPAEALAAMGVGRVRPERGRYLNEAWNRGDLGVDRLRKYRDEIMPLHDAGIRWVDTQLARLVDGLRSLSLWDTTLFVQTADHGEEFLDHGGRFHFPSRAYQELLHVPLLMRVPGVQTKPISDAPFSHVHLAPTVLDAMGIDPPPEFEGRSYWTGARHGGGWEWAVSESIGSAYPVTIENRMKGRVLAVQDRRYKMVVDFERKQEELFDLESDPRELQALSPKAEAPVRARLLGWALQHLNRPRRGFKRELAIRARLREVGLEWRNSKMNPKILAS